MIECRSNCKKKKAQKKVTAGCFSLSSVCVSVCLCSFYEFLRGLFFVCALLSLSPSCVAFCFWRLSRLTWTSHAQTHKNTNQQSRSPKSISGPIGWPTLINSTSQADRQTTTNSRPPLSPFFVSTLQRTDLLFFSHLPSSHALTLSSFVSMALSSLL